MINIFIGKTRNLVTSITCSGHSPLNTTDADVVCAAVSAIVTGGANAINQCGYEEKINLQIKSGYALFQIDLPILQLTVIIDTLYWQLKTIYEQFPDQIEWSEEDNDDEI